jgi:hypothetical protein
MRADLARRHRQALPPCRDVHSGTFVLPRKPSTIVRRVKVHKGQCQVKSSQVKSLALLGSGRAQARASHVHDRGRREICMSPNNVHDGHCRNVNRLNCEQGPGRQAASPEFLLFKFKFKFLNLNLPFCLSTELLKGVFFSSR